MPQILYRPEDKPRIIDEVAVKMVQAVRDFKIISEWDGSRFSMSIPDAFKDSLEAKLKPSIVRGLSKLALDESEQAGDEFLEFFFSAIKIDVLYKERIDPQLVSRNFWGPNMHANDFSGCGYLWYQLLDFGLLQKANLGRVDKLWRGENVVVRVKSPTDHAVLKALAICYVQRKCDRWGKKDVESMKLDIAKQRTPLAKAITTHSGLIRGGETATESYIMGLLEARLNYLNENPVCEVGFLSWLLHGNDDSDDEDEHWRDNNPAAAVQQQPGPLLTELPVLNRGGVIPPETQPSRLTTLGLFVTGGGTAAGLAAAAVAGLAAAVAAAVTLTGPSG